MAACCTLVLIAASGIRDFFKQGEYLKFSRDLLIAIFFSYKAVYCSHKIKETF